MQTKKELLTAGAANVTLTIDIDAPLGVTWKCMIEDIGQWWRPDFLVCQGSRGMRMEARLGGRLYEALDDDADAGLVWGTILSFQPVKHLAYVAQIVPPWGGPAQSVVQIALAANTETPEERTTLTLTDSLIGHVSEDLLSCLDDGWRQLFGEGGLKSHVESLAS